MFKKQSLINVSNKTVKVKVTAATGVRGYEGRGAQTPPGRSQEKHAFPVPVVRSPQYGLRSEVPACF